MCADFQYYLNRTGPRGPKGYKGDKGDDGKTPVPRTGTNTPIETTIIFDTGDGNPYETPNLKYPIEDRGGDMVMLDRTNNTQYYGTPNQATDNSYGVVKLATPESVLDDPLDTDVVTYKLFDDTVENLNNVLTNKANIEDIPTVGNGTITIKQGNSIKGTFTTNQSNNSIIELDASGGGGGGTTYHAGEGLGLVQPGNIFEVLHDDTLKVDRDTNDLGVNYGDGLKVINRTLVANVDGTTITTDANGALTAIGGGGTVDTYTKAETDALLANKITTTAPTSPLEWLPNIDNLIKSSVDDNYNGTSSNYLRAHYSQSTAKFYDYTHYTYIVNDSTGITPPTGYTIGTWDDLDTLLCPYIEFDYTTDMVLFDNDYSVVYGYYDTNNKFKEVLCCFRTLRYIYILGEQTQNDTNYRVINYYEGSNSGYNSPTAILLNKENNTFSYRCYATKSYGLATGISQTEIDKITTIRVVKISNGIYNTPFSKVVTSSNFINSGTWNEFVSVNYTNKQPIWNGLHPEQLNLKYDSDTLGVNSNNELYSKIGDGTITLTQGTTTLGTFSVNQSGNTSINIPASGGGGGTSYAAGDGIDISGSDVISAKVDGTTIGIDSSTKEIKLLSSIPTDTSDLTNSAGYITGITSGDVTTALGYTPYSSSNPNGYTSNVGTVTSVNNTQPDSDGNVTLSIPDTTNIVTTNTTQTISGSKTFSTETHHQGVITFDSALGTPIIRGTSGSSYRNMIARSNTYSTVTTGNTSDNLILKGALTRPKYSHDSSDGNYLALYSDIPGDMTGAGSSTAGAKGLVPAPAAGDNEKFLRGDGTWQTVSGGGSGDAYTKTETDALLVQKISGSSVVAPLESIQGNGHITRSDIDNTYTVEGAGYPQPTFYEGSSQSVYQIHNEFVYVVNNTSVTLDSGYTAINWKDLSSYDIPYIEVDYTDDIYVVPNYYLIVYGYYDNDDYVAVFHACQKGRDMGISGLQQSGVRFFNLIDYYSGSNYNTVLAVQLSKTNNTYSCRSSNTSRYNTTTGISSTEVDKITSIRIIPLLDKSGTLLDKVTSTSNTISDGNWSTFLNANYTTQNAIWTNIQEEQLSLKYDSSTLGVNASGELYAKSDNTKADTDLSNLSNTGKVKVANLGMPASSSVSVTIPADNGNLTAPYNGYYRIEFHSNSNRLFYFHIRDNIVTDYLGSGSFSDLWVWHPVSKGTVTTFNYANLTVDSAVFVKAIGEVNS